MVGLPRRQGRWASIAGENHRAESCFVEEVSVSFLSATMLLFLVMDPFGNIPLFLSVLRQVPLERRRRVVMREMLFAMAIMVFFLFFGVPLIHLLQIDRSSIGIAGGVVLFMIAIKMVFGRTEQLFQHSDDGEPFVVPLATPFIAGPTTIAVVLLLMAGDPLLWHVWLGAVFVAWLITSVVLIASASLQEVLGTRTIIAIERLMGFILATVAVDMFMKGVSDFLATFNGTNS
jgi:multiple antibiotic resistance protein